MRAGILLLFLSSCGTTTSADGGTDAALDTSSSDAAMDVAVEAGTPCTSGLQCTGSTPACDTMKGVCVGCRDDNDCASLVCDTKSGECRDCVTNMNCSNPLPVCDMTTRQCTATCMTDQDCPQGGSTPHHCHPTLKVCVDCYQGSHCGTGFCETVTYSCVGCLKDANCPMMQTCGPSLECTPKCMTDQNCPNGLHCDTKASACVECVTNKDCPGGICQTNKTCG